MGDLRDFSGIFLVFMGFCEVFWGSIFSIF